MIALQIIIRVREILKHHLKSYNTYSFITQLFFTFPRRILVNIVKNVNKVQ